MISLSKYGTCCLSVPRTAVRGTTGLLLLSATPCAACLWCPRTSPDRPVSLRPASYDGFPLVHSQNHHSALPALWYLSFLEPLTSLHLLTCMPPDCSNVFPTSPAQRYNAQVSRTRPSRSSRFGRCLLADTRAAPGPEITMGKKGKESVRVTL